MSTLTLKKKKTRDELCDEWLHSFPAFQKHQLMKVGIDKDLRVKYDEEPRPFGFNKVRFQVRRRTIKPWYHKLLADRDNEPRYDLYGNLAPFKGTQAA